MLFRTKPVEIEAHLWDGDWSELSAWAQRASDGNGTSLHYFEHDGLKTLKVRTLEGDMIASRGDWIICGLRGEFYPCKPDVFEKKYERVLTEDPGEEHA